MRLMEELGERIAGASSRSSMNREYYDAKLALCRSSFSLVSCLVTLESKCKYTSN